MRSVYFLCLLLSLPALASWAQSRKHFVGENYESYPEWFYRYSQADELYSHGSTLYIFGHQAQVYSAPSRHATPVTELLMGQAVENIAYTQDDLPLDNINGYGDLWYHVTGRDRLGSFFTGYLWGADIARGWRRADITGDERPEFVLLGLSSRPRQSPRDIEAEIRVLQSGRLLAQHIVPGLCLFEDCATSPMLRILKDPQHKELSIIEASTMANGCSEGIEKAFFFWNGQQLDRVFHAEYTTRHAFTDKAFSLKTRDGQSGRITGTKVCRFSHEDETFNPVWDCRVIPLEEGKHQKSPEKDQNQRKDRAK